MKKYNFALALLFLVAFYHIHAQANIDLETGVAFSGYNDIRIPGKGGTRLSLSQDLNSKPTAFYRLRLGYTIKSRHNISLLFAPLEINSDGKAPNDISFEDVVFPSGTELEGTYKFNSYRLTYRYDIIKKRKIIFGLGITGKIRDARVALKSDISDSEKTNVGFVPLINFKFSYNINDLFSLLVEGDALAAPQGRAEDVLIAGAYKLSERLTARAGYRILEGGADNDEVYNFSLVNYATVGLNYTFKKR